ncbi:TRAP transporter substrate-binding protein [Bordetella sp. 2513F-2]
MFKRLISASIATCAFGLGALPVTAHAQKTAIFGASDAAGSLYDRQNRMFVDEVNKRAAGKLKINYIPGEQLGNDVQVIEQVMGNSVQFYGDDLSWYANWVKDFGILGWGFTFHDNAHMARFLESQTYAGMAQALRDGQGIRLLAAAPIQPRVLFATRPVAGVQDLQGMKMRVPEIKTYLALWETLGARPTRVAWGETFLGLKTGVIEGAEGPVSAAYAAKFHDAAKYVVRTDHILTATHLLVNEKFYQSLSPDVRQIVDEAARNATAWARREAEAETEGLLDKMGEQGATVSRIDVAPLREKARAGVEQMEASGAWRKGLWAEVQSLSQH